MTLTRPFGATLSQRERERYFESLSLWEAFRYLTNPIVKLDDSCTSNPEIRSLSLDSRRVPAAWRLAQFKLRLRISGFEVQESSNFTIGAVPNDYPCISTPLWERVARRAG